ncbi:MAG TPA: hypothetical protein VFT99_00100, partial [Roseiflexaceae bacterium]|nr:hypothetical protein [Roseiflexaceae bacterium]
EVILIQRRNLAGGYELRIRIQVRSPFGHSFAMQVGLESCEHAIERLAGTTAGAWVKVSGTIDWPPVLSHIQAGTLAHHSPEELVLRAHTLEIIPAEANTSSLLSFQGRVATPPRITRHPYRKNIVLASTTLETIVAETNGYAAGNRTTLKRVPIVIALQHPDAPNIFRDGNIVAVAGGLERIVFPRSPHDAATALATFEEAWHSRLERMGPRERAIAERQYSHRQHHATHIDLARCVLDRAELRAGTPASSQEARHLRELHIRKRRTSKQKHAATGNTAPTD